MTLQGPDPAEPPARVDEPGRHVEEPRDVADGELSDHDPKPTRRRRFIFDAEADRYERWLDRCMP